MRDILPLLERQLRPQLVQFSFQPADVDQFELRSGDVIQLLEYRNVDDPNHVLMLDICVLTTLHSITAELWCPADLRRTSTVQRSETVARYRRVWHYEQDTDANVLAAEILRELVGWLNRTSAASMPC